MPTRPRRRRGRRSSPALGRTRTPVPGQLRHPTSAELAAAAPDIQVMREAPVRKRSALVVAVLAALVVILAVTIVVLIDGSTAPVQVAPVGYD